jgi:predicted dehydrogenase
VTPHTTGLKPLGVGVVGLSANRGWAAKGHLPALNAVDGFDVRGLVASTPESAEKSAAKYGIPFAGTDVAELAARDDIDLVVVAVRTPRHRELIRPVLAAGKAVVSEWPLAVTLAEARELADLAERHGARTAVGLQSRFTPAVRYLRDLLADGFVGEVLSTSLVASAGAWGPVVADHNVYSLDRDSGATMLTIPLGHTLDALVSCLSGFDGVTATAATRRTEVRHADTGALLPQTAHDQLAVTGVLESGAVASVHFRGGASRGTNLLWEINGTDGDLVVTGDSGHLQLGQVTLRGARGGEKELADLPVPARYTEGLQLAGPAAGVEQLYRLLLADLRTGTRSVPDFADAVRHHQLLDRITRAAETGARQ